jgi:hypothetical protein
MLDSDQLMNKDWVTATVIIILALSVAFVIVSYSVFTIINGRALEPPASTTLATAVGGIVGILGAWVGRYYRGPPGPGA